MRFDKTYHCHSTPEQVRACLTALRQDLEAQAHPAAQAPQWEVVLAEALNNVVEHAYGNVPGQGITLSVSFEPHRLRAEIQDRGAAMPKGDLPPKHTVAPETLPEGGFGWFLIHQMTDHLEYNRRDGLNLLLCEMSW